MENKKETEKAKLEICKISEWKGSEFKHMEKLAYALRKEGFGLLYLKDGGILVYLEV